MTTIGEQHLSGVQLDWLFVRELVFRDVSGRDAWEAIRDVSMQLEMTHVLSEDKQACKVLIRLTIAPQEDNPSYSELTASLEAQFSVPEGAAAAPTVSMEEFATKQAPVILVPFLREAIASVTQKSRLGSILIPPLNVASFIDELAKKPGTGATSRR